MICTCSRAKLSLLQYLVKREEIFVESQEIFSVTLPRCYTHAQDSLDLVMPTVFSHPVVPLAIGLGLGTDAIPKRLLVAGVLGSILPDLDVLSFYFGVPYGDEFGHRGFSHSFMFAALLALLGACTSRFLQTSFAKSFLFLFVTTGSHGMLDALTSGGLGIAFFWPWSANRYFAPFRPIKVSPIGLSLFFSHRGIVVLLSELLWIWMPCAFAGLALAAYRRRSARRHGVRL
jgi:inner membrane protein